MQRNSIFKFLRDSAILFVGVLLAGWMVSGIEYDSFSTLLGVALLLSALNLFLKPLLVLFALPFVIFTMGIGLWFINAALFYIAGELIDGFTVASFGTALIGSLIVSFSSIAINLFLAPKRRVRWSVNTGSPDSSSQNARTRRVSKSKDEDVIDV